MKFSIKVVVSVMLVLLAVSCSYAALPSVTMLSLKTSPACAQMQKILTYINNQYSGRIETNNIYLEDNPELAAQFNVKHVPTLVYMDANGRIIAIEVGYKTADRVLAVFRKMGVKY